MSMTMCLQACRFQLLTQHPAAQTPAPTVYTIAATPPCRRGIDDIDCRRCPRLQSPSHMILTYSGHHPFSSCGAEEKASTGKQGRRISKSWKCCWFIEHSDLYGGASACGLKTG